MSTWDELYEAYKEAKPEDVEKALEDPEDAERFNTQADADFCMLIANYLSVFIMMGGQGDSIGLENLDVCKKGFNNFKDSKANKLPNGTVVLDMLVDEVNSLKDNPSKTTEEMMESMMAATFEQRVMVMEAKGESRPPPGVIFKRVYVAFKEAKPGLVKKPSSPKRTCLNAAQETFLAISTDLIGIDVGMAPFAIFMDAAIFDEALKQYDPGLMEVLKTLPGSPTEKPEDVIKEVLNRIPVSKPDPTMGDGPPGSRIG